MLPVTAEILMVQIDNQQQGSVIIITKKQGKAFIIDISTMVKRVSLVALRRSSSSGAKTPIKNEGILVKNEVVSIKDEEEDESRMVPSSTNDDEVKKRKRYS